MDVSTSRAGDLDAVHRETTRSGVPSKALQHWRLRFGASGPYVLDAFAVCLTAMIVLVVATPTIGPGAALAAAVISAAIAALCARGWRQLRDSGGRWSRNETSPAQLVRILQESRLSAQEAAVHAWLPQDLFLDDARSAALAILENPLSTPAQREYAQLSLSHPRNQRHGIARS